MSSFPIRGLQNASDVDKSNVPTLPISDRETEHKELPVDGNPAPSSPSYVSEGHDHASNHGSETPSEPQARSDPVSESSGGSEHMDWSPISPVISTPGHSGPSSDDDDEVNASTTAATKESLLDSAALLPLPTFSPGLLTHAHQQAMANRITYDAIAPGAIFDPTTYTPVFLHDTLMLPGSLAAVLGKESQLDILERLTPARLPSFTILCDHASPHASCLLPSNRSSDPVATGLLLLGTGRDSRRAIKEHYRPVAKRQRLQVVIEVKVPVPRSQRLEEDGDDYDDGNDDDDASENIKWRLEARWLEAQAFVWKAFVEGNERNWELGEAIAGAYEIGDMEVEVEEIAGDADRSEVGEEAELGNLRLDGDSEWARPGVFGKGKSVESPAVEW